MEIGRKIIHLASVDSTSNYTANLIRKNEIAHGTVIMADEQFAGRGQRDAEWQVNPGENLTFSVFIDNVNLSVERQFYITQVIALIIIDVLQNFGIVADIKWPNDIFVNGKKIAGILIENHLEGPSVKSSVIGIGINVNQKEFNTFAATSLFLEDNKYRNVQEVLFTFINVFNNLWLDYSEENQVEIKQNYLTKLYLANIEAKFEDKNGPFFGMIKSVSESGKLMIEKEGTVVQYNLKEITFLL